MNFKPEDFQKFFSNQLQQLAVLTTNRPTDYINTSGINFPTSNFPDTRGMADDPWKLNATWQNALSSGLEQ